MRLLTVRWRKSSPKSGDFACVYLRCCSGSRSRATHGVNRIGAQRPNRWRFDIDPPPSCRPAARAADTVMLVFDLPQWYAGFSRHRVCRFGYRPSSHQVNGLPNRIGDRFIPSNRQRALAGIASGFGTQNAAARETSRSRLGSACTNCGRNASSARFERGR
jgi:hypothetical protein